METVDASEIHAQLGHPVIDSDAHWLEFGPLVVERMRPDRRRRRPRPASPASRRSCRCRTMGPAERHRAARPSRLLDAADEEHPGPGHGDAARRCWPSGMEELGLDFCVHVPDRRDVDGPPPRRRDPPRRRAGPSTPFSAELLRRPRPTVMTPVAVIPMHTPDEAIAELEHVRDRARPEGVPPRRHDPPRRPRRAGRRRAVQAARQRLVRRVRHRQRPRLRPGVGGVPRARRVADLPRRWSRLRPAPLARRTSPTTTSATSPRPRRRSARRCSSAASPVASPSSASRSSRAARRGRASSTPT